MSRFVSSTRRVLLAVCAVLVLGGLAVGVAAAQATPTPTGQNQSGYQAFVDALARRLGVTSANLQQAISQARGDVGLPANGQGFPFGRGGGGHGGPGGGDFTTAAQAIGISADQLRQELPGKSLAQVAQAHGKNPTDVANALKNAAHQRIDQAVSAGRLPADQATQQKTQVDQRTDQQMNEVRQQGGQGTPRGSRP
jgi:DNA-binding transcriptional regulator YdaS (Cro superfamily)